MDLTEVEREGALSRSEYGLVLGVFFLNTMMRLVMRLKGGNMLTD